MLDFVRRMFRLVFEASLWLFTAVVVLGSLFFMVQGGAESFLRGLLALAVGGVSIILYGGVISMLINIDKNLEKIAGSTVRTENMGGYAPIRTFTPAAPATPTAPIAPAAPVTPFAPVAPAAPFTPVAPAATFTPVAPVTPVNESEVAPITTTVPAEEATKQQSPV